MTFVLQAAAYLELDRARDAERAAERGLSIDAKSPQLLELLGISAWHQRQLVKAERAFLAGLRIEPEDPFLMARYALVCAQAGQLDKAQGLIDRAVARAPDEPFIGTVRSLVAYLSGDEREAAQLGRDVLSRDPGGAGIHALMGTYLLSSGAVGPGARHHLTSAASDPGDASFVNLGRHAKYLRNPLIRPMWLLERFGPGKVWFAFVAIMLILQLTGLEQAMVVTAGIYLFMVIYSWVIPPLVRKRYGIVDD